MTKQEAYDQGYIDGITCFAWHGKEGMEVGTTGRSLKTAIERRKENYNYSPPEYGEDNIEQARRQV